MAVVNSAAVSRGCRHTPRDVLVFLPLGTYPAVEWLALSVSGILRSVGSAFDSGHAGYTLTSCVELP